MTDVLPYLPWGLAFGLLVLVLVALGLRRWGGRRGMVAGAVLAWLACGLAALWAGSSLLEAITLLGQ